jgi:hypothetical protein
MSTDTRYHVLCADVSPLTYGGTFYRGDLATGYDVFEVQPVAEYVGETEAAEVGYPFWSRESYHDREDIAQALADGAALRSMGMDRLIGANVEDLDLSDVLAVVYAMHSYGLASDDGPSGWSADLPLEDLGIPEADGVAADDDFRRDVLGEDDDTDDDTDDGE